MKNIETMALPQKAASIAPIDALELPPALCGREGFNRALTSRPQIAADTDVEAIRVWLARFADSKTTLESYRKEAERLMLWCVVELGKPLSSMTHEDFLVYQRFLADPQPQERWVSAGGRKVARGHEDWRPFQGPLAPSSQRQAMVILNVMFSWLVEAGYLAGNPLALSRQRARKAKPRVTRYLDAELWQEVKASIEAMPKETDRERAHYFRARWLFTLFYLGGLRISEVAENTMGDFFCRRGRESEERWWLEILGKGSKERLVPATDELMVELVRYRRENGLPPFPAAGETTPLLLAIGQSKRPLTRAALHLIVKQIFGDAAARLRGRGEDFWGRAAHLEQASAHWLRHTAGSHMADNQIDLRLVRDNLGHESIATTNQYLHADDDKRHAVLEERHRMRWSGD